MAESTGWHGTGRLLQDVMGLFQPAVYPVAAIDEPRLKFAVVRPKQFDMGDLHVVDERPMMSGTGTATNRADALGLATAEALERFCSTVFQDAEIVWASAEQLGDQAVALESFPRCSEHEERDPAWPLLRPNRTAQMRWIRAVSLMTGLIRFLPLRSVMITPAVVPAERFLHSISTGCAVQRSYAAAVLSGMLEVMERDALALTWLQRRNLPLITDAEKCMDDQDSGRALGGRSKHVPHYFYDATTEFGIPTVYGVRRSRFDRRLHTIVSCATALNPSTAVRKAAFELCAFAVWLRSIKKVPGKMKHFNHLCHGPLFMGDERRAAAFDFLLQSDRKRTLSEMTERSPLRAQASTAEQLGGLIKELARRGHEAYAADLTIDEAVRSGFYAARVVIPSLMPFSHVQRARFLGHPRLYDARADARYPPVPEPELNPFPQPFG